MTTEEIHAMIENCDYCGQGGAMHIRPILERINNKLAELEKRLDKSEGTARRAANVADCLANGIQPD